MTNKFGRKPVTRVELSPPLVDVLNVTALLRTNLKIISVGDSVGMQFHEVLEEALQRPEPQTEPQIVEIEPHPYRTVYQNAWGAHESVSVAAPVHGGGALAAFRMTGLLLEEGRGKPPPNDGPDQRSGAGGGFRSTIESFDAMIFRLPHGWLPASSFTRERLEASLRLAQELFGVRTVIIQSLFVNNNVKTEQELADMRATNQIIRTLVEDSWESPDLPDLLFMDFGGWVDQLTELNARLAGMNIRNKTTYVLERLGCKRFPPSIALSCAKAVEANECTCNQNVISRDGMHWCMETVGGRITGGIACLLQCSLSIPIDDENNNNNNGNNGNGGDTPKMARHYFATCQQRCNDEFMSLRKATSLLHAASVGNTLRVQVEPS
eukprot:jgi/Psemu1/293770/fgenesh1_pg.3980_\